MAITTYTELKTAVANWMDRTDLTARIPEFIALAEAQMFRRLRTTRSLARSTATISTSDEFSSVPTDLLEIKALKLEDSSGNITDLEPTTLEQIQAWEVDDNSAGRPRAYAITGTVSGREVWYYPAPDATYTATMTYYAKPAALSDSQASNWILENAPDAYLYGALLQAAPYMRDTEFAPIWNAGFDAALTSLERMERTQVRRLRVDAALRTPTTYDINRDF